MNSLGAASPKIRSINVEVNLLSEWSAQRKRLREERVRWTGLLVLIVVAIGALAPALLSADAVARQRAAKASKALASRTQALAALNGQMEGLRPAIDGGTMLTQCRDHAETFMGQVLAVLNAAGFQTAIEAVDASVIGGEMTIREKAHAETYSAAQECVAATGRGQGVKATILASVRRNEALGPDGVTFEITKKVGVGR